jgi:hypothetical protein
MDEQLVLQSNALYCWRGPKMGMTIFNAKLGQLVLTDQRLLFLSAGKTDAGRRMAGAAGLPAFGGSKVAVSLDHDGGLEVPIQAITRCEKGAKRALLVWYRGADGAEEANAFGERMGMPHGPSWVAEINRLRGVV